MIYMHFSKKLQGAKSIITMHKISIDWTFLIFILIDNFLALKDQTTNYRTFQKVFYWQLLFFYFHSIAMT